MTLSNEQHNKTPSEKLHRGYVQFRVGQALAHDVLNRIYTPDAYDMMRRRQGGDFYATIPRPIYFLADGNASEKDGELKTHREWQSELQLHSRQKWIKTPGPRIDGVTSAGLFRGEDTGGLPDVVRLQFIADARSHYAIMGLVDNSSPEQGDLHQFTPHLHIALSHIAIREKYRDKPRAMLYTVQEVVHEYNDSETVHDEHYLEAPARLYVPSVLSKKR